MLLHCVPFYIHLEQKNTKDVCKVNGHSPGSTYKFIYNAFITRANKPPPASHVEVGCSGTWELELLTPNPGSKSTPQACPTCNSATSPARHTQPHPQPPSHRARSSVKIIITVITNKSNNNKDNNDRGNNNKRERRVEKSKYSKN